MRAPRLKRNTAALALLISVSLTACDGKQAQDSSQARDLLARPAQQKSGDLQQKGWGPMLLSLVPERGDQSTPSTATVRAAFKSCGITHDGPPSGRCDLLGGLASSPGAPSASVVIDSSGNEAEAVRISACCSSDENFFRPIQNQPIIRTELICPELTIVSSETVQAFRVSSTGKRDFVYARGSRTTTAGRRVDLTLILAPIEPSDECSSLAAAHARFID